MERINQPNAPGGRFQDDDDQTGAVGTTVTAEFLNALQDEALSVIEAAGLTPDGGDLTQITQAISILGGGGGGLVNRLVNGTLQVWQRGAEFDVTPTPIYTADRWRVQSDGTGGAGRGRVTRETRGSRPGVVGGLWDYLRYTPQIAANAGGPRIAHRVEGLAELCDRRLTFSFLARAATQISINVEIRIVGVTPTTVIANVPVTIDSSWSRQSVSIDVPALASGDFNGQADYLQIELRLPNLDSNVVDLGRMQLEEGGSASDFEQRTFDLEYLLAQRYFTSSYSPTQAPGTGATAPMQVYARGGNPEAFHQVRFPVPMRRVPSIRFYRGSNVGEIVWDGIKVVNGFFVVSASRTALPMPVIVGGGPAGYAYAQFHFTADAEI